MDQTVIFQMIYDIFGQAPLYIAASFFGFALLAITSVLIVKIFIADE